jgi:hypothetical protein
VKYAAFLLLICLVGCAAAQDGYTTSQDLFLRGGQPVGTFEDDTNFEQYVETFWSSYIENPVGISTGPIQTGPAADVSRSMDIWMIGFQFNISDSSFGKEPPQYGPNAALAQSIFGTERGWLYNALSQTENFTMEEPNTEPADTVQKNSQFLQQEIKKHFDL